MGMVCTGTPPNMVCTEVPDEPSGNGGTQPAAQATNGAANVPRNGSVMGEAPTTTEAPKVATVPANSPTPAGALVIPNYNMNIFIGIAIIVAGLGIGYYFGRR